MTERLRAEPTAKRIRATLGGHVVLDSTDVLLVWEIAAYPQFYVPTRDIAGVLEATGPYDDPPGDLGDAQGFDVVAVDGTRARNAAWTYPDHPVLADHVRFDWKAMDAWFEEDEEVYVHPRSPYVRVDTLRTSRDVRIEVDGVTVAHSTTATLLFETGLPPRWYLPATDVRLDLLRPSDTRTSCPYKGDAHYHSVEVEGQVHEDLVWSYRTTLPESAAVAGLLCFADERVDVYVDRIRQDRPRQ